MVESGQNVVVIWSLRTPFLEKQLESESGCCWPRSFEKQSFAFSCSRIIYLVAGLIHLHCPTMFAQLLPRLPLGQPHALCHRHRRNHRGLLKSHLRSALRSCHNVCTLPYQRHGPARLRRRQPTVDRLHRHVRELPKCQPATNGASSKRILPAHQLRICCTRISLLPWLVAPSRRASYESPAG